MGTTVVTGANRGLGLEFVKQLVSEGETVVALCRDPSGASELQAVRARVDKGELPGVLSIRAGDVTDSASLEAAAKGLSRLDLLINNAGVMGERGAGLAELDLEDFKRVMDVNVYGVIRATRAFLPALKAAEGAKVATISSLMGSLGDNGSGGHTSYRVSKAAVNMVVRNMGYEFESDGLICFALHPGWVQTDMGGPDATLTVDESVSGLADVIEGAGGGGFRYVDYSGKELAF